MNPRAIQRRIIGEKYAKAFMLPNFTPPSWYECDIFEITDAGYFVEYEIKMSLGDFRADQRKNKGEDAFGRVRNKHLELNAADARGPSRFWFIFPAGIIRPSIVPDWAGILEATTDPARPRQWELVTIREAPRLHKFVVSESVRNAADKTCYWRMQRLFLKDDSIQFNKTTDTKPDEIPNADSVSVPVSSPGLDQHST